MRKHCEPGVWAGGVEEFDLHLADGEAVAGIDAGQIGFGNAGDLLHAIRLGAVGVDLHRALFEQFDDAGDAASAHAAADVVGVVVRGEGGGEGVVLLVDVGEEAVDVPCGVHHRHLTRRAGTHEVGEVGHGADLNLLDDEFVLGHRLWSLAGKLVTLSRGVWGPRSLTAFAPGLHLGGSACRRLGKAGCLPSERPVHRQVRRSIGWISPRVRLRRLRGRLGLRCFRLRRWLWA